MSKILVIRLWKAILNIHERSFPMTLSQAGAVLASLSGPNDSLWPREQWPPMFLDRGLSVGSSGGHSKIRYTVTEYIPGRRAEFTFDSMSHLKGLRGRHYFDILPLDNHVIIRHTIDARINFPTWVYWKLFIEQIHDAVLEDAFDKVERHIGIAKPHRSRWSCYVRFLRWLRSRSTALAKSAELEKA